VSKKNNPDALKTKLQALRKQIDAADRSLLSALGARFRAVEKVGTLKHAHGLPLYQKARWEEVVEDRVKTANKVNVNEKFTRDFLKLIHKEALRIQTELAPKKTAKKT
jgi:chorismate mutase